MEEITTVDVNNHTDRGIIHELRFGNCPNLREIDCSSQKLTVLYIKKAKSLTSLNCEGNQLTSLDISKCTALKSLDCCYNQLTLSALNSLFRSLPTGKTDEYRLPYQYTF